MQNLQERLMLKKNFGTGCFLNLVFGVSLIVLTSGVNFLLKKFPKSISRETKFGNREMPEIV